MLCVRYTMEGKNHELFLVGIRRKLMSGQIFWGEKGEYGPFSRQEDGWPHAGEVIRHYRRKQHMQPKELALRYSTATRSKATARWILKMEQKNEVPTDINRRRILANILDIPPILLGIASLPLTQQIPQIAAAQTPQVTAILQQRPLIDLASYEQYIRNRWLLSYTGEEDIEEVVSRISELEELEKMSSGEFQRRIWQILNAYYQLASDVTRHQGAFSLAFPYANNAVRVTRLLASPGYLAAALYRRGYTLLEWAIFGDASAFGIMNDTPDKTKLHSARSDFEEAMPHARPQLKGAILLEMSRVQGLLKDKLLSLNLVLSAQDQVDAGSTLSDPLEQILLDGALNGLNEGMYLLGKTASLITLGKTTTAIELLDGLEELKQGKGIARNHTRRVGYIDLLYAQASLGTRDYTTAVTRATSAFQTFRDIRTAEKIAWVKSIHRTLTEKSGNAPEVKRLGEMLSLHYKKKPSPKKEREE